MTNLHLEPGTGSLEELISEVDEGLFLQTNRSWSIDDKRLNFQFGTQMAWEIKSGKLGRLLPRRDLHGRDTGLLGLARPRRRARGVGDARPDELRQGPARPARARLARRLARAVPERPGRGEGVSERRARARGARARLVSGDEAEVVVTAERSGFARYAGSEVHQPTLIENASVQLRLVRDGRAGVATTNRTDDEGLAELVRRATDVVASASPEPGAPAARAARRAPRRARLRRGDGRARRRRPGPPRRGRDRGVRRLRPVRLLHERRGASWRSPRRTGLRASQRTTDANWLALAAVDGASGLRDPHVLASRRHRPGRGRRGGGREGRADARRAGGASRPSTAPCSSRTRSPSSSTTARSTVQRARPARGAKLLRRPDRRAGVRPEGDARRRRARPRRPPDAFDYEGTPKQRVTLVEEGVIRGPCGTGTTAARAGRESTGHALPPDSRAYGRDCDRGLDGARARPSRWTSWPSSSATASTSRASTTSASSTRARA